MKPITNINSAKWSPAPTAELLELFPTSMLKGEFDLPHDVIAEDCRRLVAEVKNRYPNDTARNYTTYFDEDLREETHQLPWFTDFSNTAKDTYIAYIESQYNIEVRNLCRNDIHLFAWISVYNTPHHHPTHNHEHCHVSGTYYVQCERNQQPIKFLNPSLLATANLRAVSNPQEQVRPDMTVIGSDGHQQEVHFHNQTGEFLLWPSYLQHEVPAHTNGDVDNYERIAISFNFKHNEPITDNMTGTNLHYGEVLTGE